MTITLTDCLLLSAKKVDKTWNEKKYVSRLCDIVLEDGTLLSQLPVGENVSSEIYDAKQAKCTLDFEIYQKPIGNGRQVVSLRVVAFR